MARGSCLLAIFNTKTMKNIIFWTALTIASFWDKISIKPEKTKRQQQFFETGETAQYFIGAVEDEVITFFKKFFVVKKISKNSPIYKLKEFKNSIIYEINGGVKNNNATIIIDYDSYGNKIAYELCIATLLSGVMRYPYNTIFENIESNCWYENDKDMILYHFWKRFLLKKYQFDLYQYVSDFSNVVELAETDTELALILLSGVPNIKKILS